MTILNGMTRKRETDPVTVWASANGGFDVDFGHPGCVALRESGGVNYITSITDRSQGATFSQASTSLQPKLVTDGTIGANVAYCDSNYRLDSTLAAADWEWLHDAGSGLTLLVVLSPALAADPNAAYGILGTKGNTGSQIGHFCSFEDRAAVRNEAYRGLVGTSTSVGAFVESAAGSFSPQTWQTLLVTLNTSQTLTARINGGASAGSDTASEDLGELGAPQHTLRILGGIANVTDYRGYLARVVLIPEALGLAGLNQGLAAVKSKYGINYAEAA